MTTHHNAMGCCGRPDIARFAALADLHPRTTRAGQKARAQLALALIHRRAVAEGNPVIAEKALRGLAQLGTVTPAAREALARAGETSLAAARGTRYAGDVERVLGGARAAALILQGIISAVGAANPADTGITDASNAVAWVNWVLGGPLPAVVSDNDVRILKAIFAFTPALISAVNAGAALVGPTDPNVQGAAAWITRNWLPNLKTAVDAAYDALPPITTTPPAPPPGGGGWVIGPATGIQCPPGQVPGNSAGGDCHVPCPTGTYRSRGACVPYSRPVGPDGRPIDYVRCPDGSWASSAARCPSTPKPSSPALLVLPAALVAWYLFK